MRRFVIFSIVFFLFNLNYAFAGDLTGDCYVVNNPGDACAGSDMAVFSVSGRTNAHVSRNVDEANYYKVCCPGTDLGNSCGSSGDTAFELTDVTNSHINTLIGTLPVYDEDICLDDEGDVTCSAVAGGGCGGDYCVIAYNQDTNSHVADCSDTSGFYNNRICCSGTSGGGTCTLDDAFWSRTVNPSGKIQGGTVCQNQNVYLMVEVSGDCSSKTSTFDVLDNSMISVPPLPRNANYGVPTVGHFVSSWVTPVTVSGSEFFSFEADFGALGLIMAQDLEVLDSCSSTGDVCGDSVVGPTEPCDTGLPFDAAYCPRQDVDTCINVNTQCKCASSGGSGVFSYYEYSDCKEDQNLEDEFGIYYEALFKVESGSALLQQNNTLTCLLSGDVNVPIFTWVNALITVLLIAGYYIFNRKV